MTAMHYKTSGINVCICKYYAYTGIFCVQIMYQILVHVASGVWLKDCHLALLLI